ncbi:MAG: hypothetical protein MHM6MM_002136 [Cercozoa sp. M6MM]
MPLGWCIQYALVLLCLKACFASSAESASIPNDVAIQLLQDMQALSSDEDPVFSSLNHRTDQTAAAHNPLVREMLHLRCEIAKLQHRLTQLECVKTGTAACDDTDEVRLAPPSGDVWRLPRRYLVTGIALTTGSAVVMLNYCSARTYLYATLEHLWYSLRCKHVRKAIRSSMPSFVAALFATRCNTPPQAAWSHLQKGTTKLVTALANTVSHSTSSSDSVDAIDGKHGLEHVRTMLAAWVIDTRKAKVALTKGSQKLTLTSQQRELVARHVLDTLTGRHVTSSKVLALPGYGAIDFDDAAWVVNGARLQVQLTAVKGTDSRQRGVIALTGCAPSAVRITVSRSDD